MSVEWMRSCYQSTWRLFKDAPGLTTRGRYYFSPPGTPFYPGPHNLGSRRWDDANWSHDDSLGEVADAQQEWDQGRAPEAVPIARTVGSSDCIERGESESGAIDPDALIDGFNPQCFVNVPESETNWSRAASVDRCSLQRFYARIILLLYEDDSAAITASFHDLLGLDVTVTVHRGTFELPAVATVISPHYAIAVVDGTRNFQQFALQALTATRLPTDYGALGTSPIWFAASQWVHDFLRADGADPAKPVLLAGHSYGGAACLVLAGRYRHTNEERRIRAITYGCPKPGDVRLAALLSRCQTTNLANDDDIVTIVPPDRATMLPVVINLDAVGLFVWDAWERPPGQLIQANNGDLSPGPPPFLDYSTLLGIAENVLGGEEILPILGHMITTYIQRIETRCRNVEWPVSQTVIDDWEVVPLTYAMQVGGDLVADEIVFEGGLKLGGDLVADEIVFEGGLKLGGDLVADEIVLEGGLKLGGDLVADEIVLEGGLKIGGELARLHRVELDFGIGLGCDFD